MKNKNEKPIGHLLVIRLSAMGDVAMTAPVLEALRAAHPQLRITVLTRPFLRPFFRNIENIEFLTFEPKARHKGALGLMRLARDIHKLGVDAIADLHDVLRTKVIRTALQPFGYPVSVIEKGREEKKELTRRTQKRLTQLIPTVERYRRTIAALGLDFELSCEYDGDRKICPMPTDVMTRTGVKRGAWIGVAPFAKHKGKIYPIPLANELVELLCRQYEHVFIFGGGEHEKSFAECMQQRHKGALSMIGCLGLSEELDVIANLDAMVTMDSSSMHMASLVGTPVVSIWGATHPYAGFYGFRQDPANVVQLDMPCRPCSVYGDKECIFGHYKCLTDISPKMVADAVARVLEKQNADKDRKTGKVKRGRPKKQASQDTPHA